MFTSTKLNATPEIISVDKFLTPTECQHFIDLFKAKVDQTNEQARSCWISKETDSTTLSVAQKLLSLVEMPISRAENFEVRYYPTGTEYRPHYDTWEHDGSERTLRCLRLGGARLKSLIVFLNSPEDGGATEFPRLSIKVHPEVGKTLVVENTYVSSNQRHPKAEQASLPVKKGELWSLHFWIRECNANQLYREFNPEYYQKKPSETAGPPEKVQTQVLVGAKENYTQTYETVLESFAGGEYLTSLKSFTISNRVPRDYLLETVGKLAQLRKQNKGTLLNRTNLSKDKQFPFGDQIPVHVPEVLIPEAHREVIKYYQESIEKSIFPLGDRQSKRFKAHNEALSRFLHYEFLPLIEKLTGRKLRPTYTYLSAYVKGADLPPHTDRSDCQFTVSFLVDKPEGSEWPIYFHKKNQPIKYKGRYEQTPPLDECLAVDSMAGGLMMFCGTDHIHFRQELKADYYNIVLLHYCEA